MCTFLALADDKQKFTACSVTLDHWLSPKKRLLQLSINYHVYESFRTLKKAGAIWYLWNLYLQICLDLHQQAVLLTFVCFLTCFLLPGNILSGSWVIWTFCLDPELKSPFRRILSFYGPIPSFKYLLRLSVMCIE